MACSNPQPAKNSCFLHTYNNPQTSSGRKTDNLRLWRPNWKNILFCGHIAVDTLPQPIAQKQQSYIKDTTDFISSIENTKIGQNTILVAMDVSSLYTNIPQEEGIKIACKAYETFHNNDPLIPTHYLREMLGLILTENSFEFNKKIIFKHMVSQWAQKRQCLLLIYSWRK